MLWGLALPANSQTPSIEGPTTPSIESSTPQSLTPSIEGSSPKSTTPSIESAPLEGATPSIEGPKLTTPSSDKPTTESDLTAPAVKPPESNSSQPTIKLNDPSAPDAPDNTDEAKTDVDAPKNGSAKNSAAVKGESDYPIITTLEPSAKSYVQAKEKKVAVYFRWQPHAKIAKYILVVENLLTKIVQKLPLEKTSVKVNLINETTYRWRVLPNIALEPPKDYPWNTIIVSSKAGLSTPQFTEASFTEVAWDPVEGANAYRIMLIKKTGSKSQTVVNRMIINPTFDVKTFTANPKGKTFIFQVQAVGDGGIKSGIARQKLEKISRIKGRPTKSKYALLAEKIPDTNVKISLDLGYGGETVEASGLIGEFSGGGSVTSASLSMELLPKPESNMMFFLISVEGDSFKSTSEIQNETSGEIEKTTTKDSRSGGMFAVTGRSDLAEDFWGLGASVYSLPMAIFEAESEESGKGALSSVSLRGAALFFHVRHKFIGGRLNHNIDFSPISAQTKSLILANYFVRWRLKLSSSLEFDASFKARYTKATALGVCSRNQPDLCSSPHSKQTMTMGLLGVNLNF